MKTAAVALALAATAFGQSLTEVLSSIPELSNLTTLFQPYAGLFANQTNITLLAPSNTAISAFLNSSTGAALATQPDLVQAILTYHVLQGSYENFTEISFVPTALQAGVYANVTGGQRVEALPGGTFFSGLLQNTTASNTTNFTGGFIHIIDSFLVLPQNVSATATQLNLSSAVGALVSADLANTVDTTQDLTIFVPNNEAFARVAGVGNLSIADLTSVLTYHVVPGLFYSTDLANTSVPTLGGSNVTITLEGESVFVNNAQVVIPNVLVRNGVVHVIDRVLNPANATAGVNTATPADAFPTATSGAESPFTSGVATPSSAIATSAATSAAGSASSGAAFRPIQTGAVGMAALFGGAAAIMNM